MNKPCLKLIIIIFISAMILGCLIPVKAAVVFQDNFGSGNLNNWTVVGSPKVVATPVAFGYAYSVQIPLSSNASYIKASFPSIGSETLELYFLSDTVLSTPNTAVIFATIVNGLTMFNLGLSCDANGNLEWVLGYPQTIYSPGTSFQVIPSAIQANTWYKFDLAIENSGTNGAFALSINDSPIYSLSSVKFNWNPTYFTLGLLAGATGYNNGNMYIDGITVTNTANIPQTTPTPSSTASPTASANPNSTPASTSTTITQPTTSPTPTVPEFPWIVILLLLFSMLSTAVTLRIKKRRNFSMSRLV